MSDEPIRLADGTLVYKDGRVVGPSPVSEPEVVEALSERDPTKLIVPAGKKVRDLPETTRTMNSISVVLAYSLFGLSADEIAMAIGTTPDRVDMIMNMPSYVTMRGDVIGNILTAEQTDVRNMIAQHSRSAVKTVVDGMNAKKTSDRLRAAGDILDRSGFRPADVVEHRHRLEGGLTIEIVRKDTRAPVIDIDIRED